MALADVQVITKFLDNATVWVLAHIYDVDGALVDPTAIKITIIDPSAVTKVDDQAMTQYDSNTGIYEYYYHEGATADAMEAGQWRGRVDVIDGTGATAIISPQGFSFEVK